MIKYSIQFSHIMQLGTIENKNSSNELVLQASQVELPSVYDYNTLVLSLVEQERLLKKQVYYYLKNHDMEKSSAVASDVLKARNLRKLLYAISCVQQIPQNNYHTNLTK